jgi:hypothetical protein
MTRQAARLIALAILAVLWVLILLAAAALWRWMGGRG